MHRRNLQILTLLAVVALSAACGGGGGGGGGVSTPVVRNAAVGGIWEGTATISGQGVSALIGLVAEDGRAHFIQDDGVQYWGTVRSSGNTITASFDGAVEIGDSFIDGSTSGTGSLNGTIQERSTITATVAFTTARGTRSSSTISLRYNALYERDSSLATVSGNYTDAFAPGSDIVNVSSSGVLFGQSLGASCVINGAVTVINPAYNAYEIQYSYANCTGVDSVLNGATFSGIATLDNTENPEVAIAGLQGRVSGALYSVIFLYQRT